MSQGEAAQATQSSPFPLPVTPGAPTSPFQYLQGLPNPHLSAPSTLTDFPILSPQCSQYTHSFPIPPPTTLCHPAAEGGVGEDSF